MSCAGYLAEFYAEREKRLNEEKAILKRWKETLEKFRKIDLAMEKLNNIEGKVVKKK